MKVHDAVSSWNFFSDKRVPLLAKVLPFVALLYGLSPLDFIPDFIPFFGQLDDAAVIAVVGVWVYRMVKKARLSPHHDVIDIEKAA